MPRMRCSFALALVLGSSAACSRSTPPAGKDPVAETAAPPVAPSAIPTASVAKPPAKPGLPTLAPEPFEGTKGIAAEFHPIEGALMVVNGLQVGRIVDEKVEWVGTLPETNTWLGGSQINGVLGAWPDAVDVRYSSNNGRASQPSIYPLTGKGTSVTFAPGGGLGWISGTARLGKTTVVGGYDMFGGYQIKTLRGPGLSFKPTPASKMGCTEEELQRQWGDPEQRVAVSVRAIAATDKGTLVTIGVLCEREKSPVAEVWDQPGKSRIIELGAMTKNIGYSPTVVVGKGDELFLDGDPVLRYHEGKFEPLPKVERSFRDIFVSPAGKLHGIAGRTIHRLDDGAWTPVANLPWPMWFSAIAMDEKGTIWVSERGVARLREQPSDLEGACKTPFVYLYEVSWKNEAKYTYPTTRKALASFPEVADLVLMEYWEGQRILGIQVKSRAQGEAVVAHVKATMKDEHPELICYSPSKTRVIEMKGGK